MGLGLRCGSKEVNRCPQGPQGSVDDPQKLCSILYYKPLDHIYRNQKSESVLYMPYKLILVVQFFTKGTYRYLSYSQEGKTEEVGNPTRILEISSKDFWMALLNKTKPQIQKSLCFPYSQKESQTQGKQLMVKKHRKKSRAY